jgi:2-phospho-L-lactate guanylyltransferase
LPVKHLDAAKGRLAGHLGPERRVELARALLQDSLELCAATPFLEWWVVSDDARVLEAAAGRGLAVVEDRGRGLNPALQAAVKEAVSAAADSVTIVPSDLPLATAEDLADIVDTGATSDVVAVPAGERGGTNALYLSPPELLPPRFGEASFAAHMVQAEALGLRCSILPLERMALDIDTIEDVDELLRRGGRPGSRTFALLARIRSR